MSKKHDVVAVVVEDPLELALPVLGLVDFQDPESGEVYTVDTSSAGVRRAYAEQVKAQKASQLRELRASGVDRVNVVSGDDFADPLIAYFRQKVARR